MGGGFYLVIENPKENIISASSEKTTKYWIIETAHGYWIDSNELGLAEEPKTAKKLAKLAAANRLRRLAD